MQQAAAGAASAAGPANGLQARHCWDPSAAQAQRIGAPECHQQEDGGGRCCAPGGAPPWRRGWRGAAMQPAVGVAGGQVAALECQGPWHNLAPTLARAAAVLCVRRTPSSSHARWTASRPRSPGCPLLRCTAWAPCWWRAWAAAHMRALQRHCQVRPRLWACCCSANGAPHPAVALTAGIEEHSSSVQQLLRLWQTLSSAPLWRSWSDAWR